MNILLLTNEYPPRVYGGAGVHVECLSRELARLEGGRHKLNILCFGEQRENGGNIEVRGVESAADLPCRDPRHGKLLDGLHRNLLMTGLAEEADVIHCHTWYTHLAGCLLRSMLKAPLVLTTHSLEPHRPWKAEQLGSAYEAARWVEKTAYQNADGVVAVSEAMKEDVEALYGVPGQRVRVIHNGIDPDVYRPVFDDEVLRAYGIDPGVPYLLFVGRITRQKGVAHLVSAVPRLDPSIQVVLCAGAPDTEAIGRETAEAVERVKGLDGRRVVWISETIPRHRLVVLYSHAHLFVCPSVYEPFGIINLEAMACETPVVASAVGGIPEIVTDGETGRLVPFEPSAEDPPHPARPDRFSRDLARAVNDLFGHPDRLRKMGVQCRRRVEEKFSWRSIARQTLDYYRSLADHFRPNRLPGSRKKAEEKIFGLSPLS